MGRAEKGQDSGPRDKVGGKVGGLLVVHNGLSIFFTDSELIPPALLFGVP